MATEALSFTAEELPILIWLFTARGRSFALRGRNKDLLADFASETSSKAGASAFEAHRSRPMDDLRRKEPASTQRQTLSREGVDGLIAGGDERHVVAETARRVEEAARLAAEERGVHIAGALIPARGWRPMR